MNAVSQTDAPKPVPMPYLINGPVYTPGASAPPGSGVVFKLASNESPVGPSPDVQRVVGTAAQSQHLYPDSEAAPLTRAIADHYGLVTEQIVPGPGSDAIINWLIQGWVGKGENVLYSAHGFQSYRIRASNNGSSSVAAPEVGMRADVPSLLAAVTPLTRILFIANPNNPTGTYLPKQQMVELRKKLRSDILLVVDEAYFEYVDAPDYKSCVDMVNDATVNVVVTRTFSKFFGVAGLRVGWAYAPRQIVETLARIRGPFAVSRIGIEGAIAALKDLPHQQLARTHNTQWRNWLQQEVRALGFETTQSVGNFILFKAQGGSNAALALHGSLAEAGFICRIANQNSLPEWIRVSIGSEQAMTGFVNALQRIVATKS